MTLRWLRRSEGKRIVALPKLQDAEPVSALSQRTPTAGTPDFYPTQRLEKPKITTIGPVEQSLGAPFGPIAEAFLKIPLELSPCVDLPVSDELSNARKIRSPFYIDSYPEPYLDDVVRAFRVLRGMKTYLEIGVFDRGNLAYIASLLDDDAILIGVDIESDETRDNLLRSTLKLGQTYVPIVGDSRLPETVQRVRDALGARSVDAVFIDGDHTAYGVTCDYINYGPLVRDGGFIMFHDCLWEGNETYKGARHALTEVDKIDPVYLVPGFGPCHRFTPPMFRDSIWGVVGFCFPSRNSTLIQSRPIAQPKPSESAQPKPSESCFFEGQDWKAKLVFDKVQAFVMEELTRKLGTIRFVQVGSNDGAKADPIQPFVLGGRWSGLLIEPIPRIFETLRKNYTNVGSLSFANVAIAEQDGSADFYSVRDPHSALSSFNYETVMKHEHWLPNIGDLIEKIKVPTLRLDSVLKSHGIETIDVLVVDTEGFDAAVISTIDLEEYKPKLIMFEHVHLSAHGSEGLRNTLTRQSYEFIFDGYDCVAISRGLFEDHLIALLKGVVAAAR
jgi:FkbM family methyltransferase